MQAVLEGHPKYLKDKDLALPKHQPYLVCWVREFLPFAQAHGGYTFEQTLDVFLPDVARGAAVNPSRSSRPRTRCASIAICLACNKLHALPILCDVLRAPLAPALSASQTVAHDDYYACEQVARPTDCFPLISPPRPEGFDDAHREHMGHPHTMTITRATSCTPYRFCVAPQSPAPGRNGAPI